MAILRFMRLDGFVLFLGCGFDLAVNFNVGFGSGKWVVSISFMLLRCDLILKEEACCSVRFGVIES